MTRRRALSELGLSTGKKAGLYRIVHRHGLGNGTAMFLPCDQGLEHGPRDFFANPAAVDPAAARCGTPEVRTGGQTVLARTGEAMDAGAIGVIYGRNIWQREHDESLRFTAKVADILTRYRSPIEATA